jgi:hypothetical protein
MPRPEAARECQRGRPYVLGRHHLAALLFADQIESVLTWGGREAVRERLSSFSDAQREVLRDTLADLVHA